MNFIKKLTQRILVGDQETQRLRLELKRMSELRRRRGGAPTTKVYKCGVCGKTTNLNPSSGQYVIFEGMALCPEHAQVIASPRLGIDIYECPSCGYKFLEGWNEDYYKKNTCSNCGRHLDEHSWD